MNISFVGFGNMGKAIAKGLSRNKQYHLSASAPSLIIGTTNNGIKTFSDNKKCIADAEIIILAVKPFQMQEVLQEIKNSIPAQALVISIAAGLTTTWYAKQGLSKFAIVRAMPNIAVEIGYGATPLFANTHVTTQQKQQIEGIFNPLGIFTWVKDEDELNIFTALSGSGPAYIFEFMSALTQGAVNLGLSKDIALNFTLQTMRGALHLAADSKLSLKELKSQVTSAKGTTEAALNVLEKNSFEKSIIDALKAAYHRSQELSQ